MATPKSTAPAPSARLFNLHLDVGEQLHDAHAIVCLVKDFAWLKAEDRAVQGDQVADLFAHLSRALTLAHELLERATEALDTEGTSIRLALTEAANG